MPSVPGQGILALEEWLSAPGPPPPEATWRMADPLLT